MNSKNKEQMAFRTTTNSFVKTRRSTAASNTDTVRSFSNFKNITNEPIDDNGASELLASND